MKKTLPWRYSKRGCPWQVEMVAAAPGTSARLHIKKARWKAGFGY